MFLSINVHSTGGIPLTVAAAISQWHWFSRTYALAYSFLFQFFF